MTEHFCNKPIDITSFNGSSRGAGGSEVGRFSLFGCGATDMTNKREQKADVSRQRIIESSYYGVSRMRWRYGNDK
jgi:hypothetical protein